MIVDPAGANPIGETHGEIFSRRESSYVLNNGMMNNGLATSLPKLTPSIDVSKDVSDEQKAIWKSNSASFSKQGGSVGNVVSKPMIRYDDNADEAQEYNTGSLMLME
ncbi:hypothetical protein Tco_0604629 [Tanacetum coccineum]